jgi:hypothetical protein
MCGWRSPDYLGAAPARGTVMRRRRDGRSRCGSPSPAATAELISCLGETGCRTALPRRITVASRRVGLDEAVAANPGADARS